MGVALIYKHGIVFFSPAGSTRLIAETIEYHLRLKGCSPFLVDLSRGRQASLEEVQTMVGHPCCIWMGSPVYCDHAVPLMHDFIEALPMATPETYAIPFVTWGEGLAVFFGSGAAEKTQPGIAAYCAAKAAEEHLARQLAAEAPSVTTLIYRPGIVETRMQVQARESQGGAAKQLQAVFRPWKEQGQLMTPEQSSAGLVRLLARDPRRLHGGNWDVRDL